jgi:hypothetical protein
MFRNKRGVNIEFYVYITNKFISRASLSYGGTQFIYVGAVGRLLRDGNGKRSGGG